jgi:hypothetical protein
MKKLFPKSGVALILTISVMTALSIMGVAFLQLLITDQRTALLKTNVLANNGALEAAIQAGFWEIRTQTAPPDPLKLETLQNPFYFGSTIESADNNSSFYFKNIIRATNTMLNIYRYGPEVDNILRNDWETFINSSDTNLNKRLNNLADKMKNNPEWHLKSLSEMTKAKDTDGTKSIGPATYEAVLPYITTQPQENGDFIMNIIDYGRVNNNANGNTLELQGRIFMGSLSGAYVKIISGPGKNQEKRILNVQNDNSTAIATLTLDSSWIIPLPTTQSHYRIYSYVCPLNFNGADKKLIEANLKIIEPFLTNNGVTISSFMNELDFQREQKTLFDENTFLSYVNRSGLVDPDKYNTFLRFFDPKQPKGIFDGMVSPLVPFFVINPIPVPWTFSSSGYFDMEIDAGMKRNLARTPEQLKKQYVTVRVSGKREQSTREEFETGAFQNMSTSDWVPVKSMADFAGWSSVNNSNFNPYNTPAVPTFIPPIPAASANVIPDAIKTGVWFDFNVLQDNRGEDFIFFDPAPPNQKIMAKDVVTLFVPSPGTTINLNAGRLEIEGNTNPASEVFLWPNNSAYSVGISVGIMLQIRDDDLSLLDPLPHSTASEQYTSSMPDINTHTWAHHATMPGTNFPLYPPQRYFTPAFFLNHTGPIAAPSSVIEFRAEKTYSTTAPFESTYNRCMPTGITDPAIYTNNVSFSVFKRPTSLDFYTGRRQAAHPDNPFPYLSNYKLFVAESGFSSSTNRFRINVNGDSNYFPNLNGLFPFSLGGRLGFKRFFPTAPTPGYHHGGKKGKFSVEYLRIISDLPSFRSSVITIPHLKKFSKLRVHYRIGARGTPFKFTMEVNFLIGNPNPVTIDPGKPETLSGYCEFDISKIDAKPQTFFYELRIHGSNGNDNEYFSFLQTTIAITKVEIFYDTKEEVIVSKDTL